MKNMSYGNEYSYSMPYLNKDSQYSNAVPVSKRVYAYDLSSRRGGADCCTPDFGDEVDSLPIAMGYVPWQMWDEDVLDAAAGLEQGTIFPELIKPFVCTPCCKKKGGM